MELLLALAAFTALHWLAWPVTGAVTLIPSGGGWRVFRGEGWGVLSPRPGQIAWRSMRRPFILGDQTLLPLAEEGGQKRHRAIERSALARAKSLGRTVRVGRQVVCRCVTRRQAERLAEWLIALASEGVAAAGRAPVARLDDAVFSQRLERGSRRLARLSTVCDVYFLSIFGVLPLAFWILSAEPALLAAGLPLGVVHVAAVTLLYASHRALFPDERGARVEIVLAAALFPPTLLHAPQMLADELSAELHPVAVGAHVMQRDDFLDLLRAEFALLERDATRDSEPDRAALLEVAKGHAIERSELEAPREQKDSKAESYCVICLADYRSGTERCDECDIPTLRYGISRP